MVGVVGLLTLAGFGTDNERATEMAGARDGGCDVPAAYKFAELILALDVGGGGNFTPPPAPPVFVFVFAFMFPPAVPGVGGAEGTVGTDAGINALLSVLLAAAFSMALFSRSL